MDGSHVKISKPKWCDHLGQIRFFSRKGFYSWNVLGICDDFKVFVMFSAKFPGSTHDSKNHNESWRKVMDERQFDYSHPRFHVGDQGFQCQKTCLTPVPQRENQVLTAAEKKYNKTLTSFRAINEHAFGDWKAMFPMLCTEKIGIVRKERSDYSQASDGSVNRIQYFSSGYVSTIRIG